MLSRDDDVRTSRVLLLVGYLLCTTVGESYKQTLKLVAYWRALHILKSWDERRGGRDTEMRSKEASSIGTELT